MKKIGFLLLATLLLAGCRKTKLDGEYLLFVGKWKWIGATETRTVISNGNSSFSYISASDFSDEYTIKFEKKGKVNFLKNLDTELSYRTVMSVFTQICYLYDNCYHFSIYLNNDDEKQLGGEISNDSLSFNCGYTNLPLVNREEGEYRYTYKYDFIKVY